MKRRSYIIILFGLLFLINSPSVASQVRKQLTIGGGIGESWIDLFIYDVLGNDLLARHNQRPFSEHIFPVFNAMAEYGTSENEAFGLALSYQAVYDYPFNYANPPISPDAAEKVSRLNMAFRYLHFIKGKGTFYYGLRIGISYWRDIVPAGMDPYQRLLQSAAFIAAPSFQALFGYRYYFGYHFGLNAEVALGTPYYGEVGTTFRIGHKKSADEPAASKSN